MNSQAIKGIKNRFLILFLLLFGASILPMWTEGAYARVRVCRGDPVIVLSDKRILRLTVEVAAFADEVDEVVYTVHVPRGVEAKQITYTGGELGKKERVDIIDDLDEENTYLTTTLITTTEEAQARKVSADVTVIAQLQGSPQSRIGKTDLPIKHEFVVTK